MSIEELSRDELVARYDALRITVLGFGVPVAVLADLLSVYGKVRDLALSEVNPGSGIPCVSPDDQVRAFIGHDHGDPQVRASASVEVPSGGFTISYDFGKGIPEVTTPCGTSYSPDSWEIKFTDRNGTTNLIVSGDKE